MVYIFSFAYCFSQLKLCWLKYERLSECSEITQKGMVLKGLTLSVPTFFSVFNTFRKLVVIQLILVIKTQTVYQTREIVHGYLLIETVFEISSEIVKKSVSKIPKGV